MMQQTRTATPKRRPRAAVLVVCVGLLSSAAHAESLQAGAYYADQLILPGLPLQGSFTQAFEAGEITNLPFEVFERTGCAGWSAISRGNGNEL
jgi:hypothetical protein